MQLYFTSGWLDLEFVSNTFQWYYDHKGPQGDTIQLSYNKSVVV